MSETSAPDGLAINAAALEPLFAPWEEPNKHRVRAQKGLPPEIKTYRRQSPIRMVNPLRVAEKSSCATRPLPDRFLIVSCSQRIA